MGPVSEPVRTQPTTTAHIHSYRPDIDGLRAIAVVAVITFHCFPTWLPGGFVGVDVFFVISGFLISGHITKDVSRGTFSYAEFYSKRSRRLFPTLIIVLFMSLLFGYVFMGQADFMELGAMTSCAAAFSANLRLQLHGSGDADTAAPASDDGAQTGSHNGR